MLFRSNDAMIGYVLTVTDHEGYGGDIQFTMGVRIDGTLNGISFLSIGETAGLGMKATEEVEKMCTFEELLQNEGKRKWIAVGKKEGREEGREEVSE